MLLKLKSLLKQTENKIINAAEIAATKSFKDSKYVIVEAARNAAVKVSESESNAIVSRMNSLIDTGNYLKNSVENVVNTYLTIPREHRNLISTMNNDSEEIYSKITQIMSISSDTDFYLNKIYNKFKTIHDDLENYESTKYERKRKEDENNIKFQNLINEVESYKKKVEELKRTNEIRSQDRSNDHTGSCCT
eukprot:UN04041